ncbi:MAG: hypothetical protein ABI467_01495 [Kofleriaceae bacterium]
MSVIVIVIVAVIVIGPVIVAVHVTGNATVIVIAPLDDQGSMVSLGASGNIGGTSDREHWWHF